MEPAVQTVQHKLSSVEALTEALSGTPWAVDFRQLNRGCNPASIKAVGTGNTMLLRLDMDNQVHQLATPAPEMMHFAIPAKPQPDVRFGRRLSDSDTLLRIDPDIGVNAVNAPDFGLYTLSVEKNRVSDILGSVGVELGFEGFGPAGAHRKLPSPVVSSLRRSAAQLLDVALEQSTADSKGLVSALETDLVLMFASGFVAGEAIPYVSRSNRSRALKRALAYIHNHATELISIDTLCKETATSLSTLQRVFREHFGVSPKQYLTAIRLSGVRRALIDPEESRNISDIASEWGFWHMSKFTADYKRHFGECPSATRVSA
jgi:AraC family ethanolamine operon transcriptional activator